MVFIVESDGFFVEMIEQCELLWRKVKVVVLKNFLFIFLILFLIFGILVFELGVFFSELLIQYVCVVGIFFYSGFKLKIGELKEVFKFIKVFIWGIVCILLIMLIIGG